jgi:hypothetical protein
MARVQPTYPQFAQLPHTGLFTTYSGAAGMRIQILVSALRLSTNLKAIIDSQKACQKNSKQIKVLANWLPKT